MSRKFSINTAYTILVFFMVYSVSIAENRIKQTLEKDGSTIHLSFPVPEKIDQIILEFHSDRNKKISRLTEVSPNNHNGT
jgi:hypothetical protein